MYNCMNTRLKELMGTVPAYPTDTKASLIENVAALLLFVNFNSNG